MLARLSLVCVIFCFHHHAANISASTRAAQWPAPSPDMTGLTAAGANPLPKGRVPAHPMALDRADKCCAPSCLKSFFISHVFTCRRSRFSCTPPSGCSRVYLLCGPGCEYDCLSCTPTLLRPCLTCFFVYISTALNPANTPAQSPY